MFKMINLERYEMKLKYEMSKYFHKFAVVQSKSKSTSTSSNFCLLN